MFLIYYTIFQKIKQKNIIYLKFEGTNCMSQCTEIQKRNLVTLAENYSV